MAKLATLHTSSGHSPDLRRQLAAAIERNTAAEDRLERINSLLSGTFFVLPAQEKLEQAQAGLALAHKHEPRRVAAQLLNDPPPPGAGASVEDATQAVEDARADLVFAERTRAALREEERRVAGELQSAKRELRDTIRRVVVAEGDIDQLLARFEETRRELNRQRDVLTFLATENLLPHAWDAVRNTGPSHAESEWQLAFALLESDPDTPLPK